MRAQTSATARIREALQGADRVVVYPSSQGGADKSAEKTILFELNNPAALAGLPTAIEVVEDGERSPCLCYGTHDMYFYRNSDVILHINYKHFSRIGLYDEKYALSGEYDLTPASQTAFAAWFAKHGFSNFQKGVGENAARLREQQEKASRVAAMFPKKIQPLISGYSNVVSSPAMRQLRYEIKDERLLDADISLLRIDGLLNTLKIQMILDKFGDKLATLKTVFRAAGTEYKEAYYREGSRFFEPLYTLRELITGANSNECEKILSDSPESDVSLFVGAFQLNGAMRLAGIKLSDATWAKIYAVCWKCLRDNDKYSVISALSWETGQQCRQLLLSIAANGIPKANPLSQAPKDDQESDLISPPHSDIDNWLYALLELSERRIPEARAIVIEKLKNAPAGQDRLALEVALACYDGVGGLRSDHIENPDWQISRFAKRLKDKQTADAKKAQAPEK